MTTELDQWVSLWPNAILFIVVGVWGAYHFLAPSNWREWTGAGLVQAFIIALYAEMYGFPLTVYLLASWLPFEMPITESSGHLWSSLLGFGRLGAAVEAIVAWPLILFGMLLIVKGWVRIYFLGDELVTSGIYGTIRHPQYAGIFLIIAGQLVNWPTLPGIVLAPVIVWLYLGLAARDDRRLANRFGNAFEEYRSAVPRFVPRWKFFSSE